MSEMEEPEDSELHDLVKEVLEKSGSMAKIRAELRASVFLALEENGCFKNTKSQNDELQSLSKNADGVLLICLVREFLEYFGLSFTASVFDPELASYGVQCACKDRSKLRSQLNVLQDLSNETSGPLLCQMLQVIRNIQSTGKSNVQKQLTENLEESSTLQNCKSSESSTEYLPYGTAACTHDSKEIVTPNKVENDVAVKSATKINHSNFGSKKIPEFKNKTFSSQNNFIKDLDSTKYNLSSLADLPPLTSPISSSKNGTSPVNKSSKQITKLKAMLKDSSTGDTTNTSVTSDNEEPEKIEQSVEDNLTDISQEFSAAWSVN